MEERLVDAVIEITRDLMHPYNSLASFDIDETEPVLMLEAGPLPDPYLVVRLDGRSVSTKHNYAFHAGGDP